MSGAGYDAKKDERKKDERKKDERKKDERKRGEGKKDERKVSSEIGCGVFPAYQRAGHQIVPGNVGFF